MTAVLTRPPVIAAPRANPELQAFREGLVKFTDADQQLMEKHGILPEDTTVELLDGLFVYRDCGSSKGEPLVASIEHDYVVQAVADLSVIVNTAGRHVRTQLTVRLTETYKPLPDGVILRGQRDDYRSRYPMPADLFCLIEVADTSYTRDAGEKLAAYAHAGVPQYVIIDLRNNNAEVYADPDVAAGTYGEPLIVPADGTLKLYVGNGETVDVPLAGLLP
jgi:hypothetical protein